MQLLLALVLIHETRTVGGLSIDVGGGAVAVAVTADIVEDSALHNVAVGWIAEALQEGDVSYLDVTAWSWYDSATATVDVTSAWYTSSRVRSLMPLFMKNGRKVWFVVSVESRRMKR